MGIFTSIATFLQSAFGFLDPIAPAISQFIIANLPAHQQAEFERRERRCRHVCRVNHFTRDLIGEQVDEDFSDLPNSRQFQIIDLICAELGVK